MKAIRMSGGFGGMFFLAAGCGAVAVLASGCESDPFAQIPPDMGTGTTTTIRHLQPALAVRGMGCLSCHANIQANVVTDFGYGDGFYLEQENPSYDNGTSIFAEGWYTPYPWQVLENVIGQVFVPSAASVPAAMVSASIPGAAAQPMPLSSFMSAGVTDFASQDSPDWYTYFGLGTAPQTAPLTQNVHPSGGNAPVATSSYVYIGAPTTSQILAAAPNPGASGAWVQIATGSSSAGQGVSGLSAVNGSTGPYVTNTGPVSCSGLDVVVNGTLLLKDLQIYAESGGCRLYVTGSVFIEGPITYLNSGSSADPTDNLQVTSAVSIEMGVGLSGTSYLSGSSPGTENEPEGSSDPLYVRLTYDSRGALLRSASTAASYDAWASGVHSEATNIGPSLIVDASNTSGAAQTSQSLAGQTRTAIDFTHLLLNAPAVHSRYLGTMTGVVIAEIAEFSLSQFVFNYDSVFTSQQVTVLPALKSDVLCVAGVGGSACGGATQ